MQPRRECDDASMQSPLVIPFGAGTFLTASLAAFYWFKSASPPPQKADDPAVSISDNPGAFVLANQASMDGVLRALQVSARFNKIAAIWTGVSALLSAATTLVGIAS